MLGGLYFLVGFLVDLNFNQKRLLGCFQRPHLVDFLGNARILGLAQNLHKNYSCTKSREAAQKVLNFR